MGTARPNEIEVEKVNDKDANINSEDEYGEAMPHDANPGAFPSQKRHEDCSESITSRSGREREDRDARLVAVRDELHGGQQGMEFRPVFIRREGRAIQMSVQREEDSDGKVIRYKTWLVFKGFIQE